jgi:F-type H+-transporting ATPase subunit gamma
MESLEQLGRTLASVESLASIVRTMKALSAVSIRQYERSVQALAGYSRGVELALHVVLRDMPPPAPPPRRPAGRLGAVVFGSDHGLCGRFNEDVTGFVVSHLGDLQQTGRAEVLAVGSRLLPLFEAAGWPPDETLLLPGSAEHITTTVHQLLEHVDAWCKERGVEDVHLFYSRRTPGGRAKPVASRLLPVDLHRFHRLAEGPWPSHALPTFTMDREELFAALVRQFLFISVFRACAESQTAEHASRLSAMQAAERNLDDRRTDVLAAFRRRRQDEITAELLDVIAGYETLRSRVSRR